MDPKAFLVVVLASACGGPTCETVCGLRLVNSDWSCSEFQAAETFALSQFKNVKDYRFIDSCALLNGWTIDVHPEKSWKTKWGEYVAGLTYCDYNYSYVNNEAPLQGSLCHELMHVVQRCVPYNDKGCMDDKDHNCWTRDGEFAVISACNTEYSRTQSSQ